MIDRLLRWIDAAAAAGGAVASVFLGAIVVRTYAVERDNLK
jgi:hypothetical protein